jgi:hypothetical protein
MSQFQTPGQIPTFRANLASDQWASPPITTGGALRITVQVNDDADTYTWGNAVLELQYSALLGTNEDGTLLEQWASFSPAVTFTTGNRSKRNISISGAGFVRLRTSTADGGADPAAIVTWRLE